MIIRLTEVARNQGRYAKSWTRLRGAQPKLFPVAQEEMKNTLRPDRHRYTP